MSLQIMMEQIIRAAENGLELVAIGMAVSLPSICSALEREDGQSYRDEYKAWCAANLTDDEFSFVTPDDLYSIRCGFLHQGRFGDLKHSVARVIFVPAGQGAIFSNCRINDAYFYGAVEFCRNMCAATQRWLDANEDNEIIRRNLDQMLRYHPSGLHPYASGLPLIA